ncbi:YdcF family protein [candidate division KSB1 bacterium]|nr:YdcF family protein [candidate division KSB1 bacterium]
MTLYYYKTKKVVKPIYKLFLAAAIISAGLLLIKPIGVGLADFLSLPKSDATCDVIVVEEGGAALSDYVVTEAIKVYHAGQAKKIILVLHGDDLKPTAFGIANYRRHVESAFDSLKIPTHDYQFLMLNVQDPYTYNSARALADTLTNIHSLLLFDDNFHMRRSYLTFKKVFERRNIAVHPYTFEIYLNSKNWWTSANGWRRVITEYTKLIFYWMKGYI